MLNKSNNQRMNWPNDCWMKDFFVLQRFILPYMLILRKTQSVSDITFWSEFITFPKYKF